MDPTRLPDAPHLLAPDPPDRLLSSLAQDLRGLPVRAQRPVDTQRVSRGPAAQHVAPA
jgi:hypothetical protein